MTAEQAGDMRALIEQIAKALVDAPDQVAVDAVDEDEATVLELKVAADDLGKSLKLPPWLEESRPAIEHSLRPITAPTWHSTES